MVSLLTGSVISKFYGDYDVDIGVTELETNNTVGNITLLQGDGEEIPSVPADVKIGIVVSLTFLVGIVQVR